MVNISGYELDLISLGPAVFTAGLSIFNWFKINKPADIYPNEIINYGYIASDFHGGMQFCIPLLTQ